jgi:flavin-dependent thymidylate synthase
MAKVTLISYTGHGHPDPLYAAKLLAFLKNTRLEQNAETMAKFFAMPEPELMKELDYISKTIRSSWEFVDYTFQISGVTRAFTHQLVRTRTASYAQQAQRVVKLTDIKVTTPDTVLNKGDAFSIWLDFEEKMKGAYYDLLKLDIPAQDARGLLATAVQTNIAMKVNLRTLADLIGKRENLRAQGEYGEIARQMREAVEAIHPWAAGFLSPERTRTPALDEILKEALGVNSPIDKPRVNEALKELDALKGTWG